MGIFLPVKKFQTQTGEIEPGNICCCPKVNSPGHCLYGSDFIIWEAADYLVTFDLKVTASPSLSRPLFVLDVYENSQTKTILVEREVRLSDLSLQNAFSLKFSGLPGQRVEFRLYWHGECLLRIYGVTLRRINRSAKRTRKQEMLSPTVLQQVWPLAKVSFGPILGQKELVRLRKISSGEGDFVVKSTARFAADEFQRSMGIAKLLQNRGFPNVPEILETRRKESHLTTHGEIRTFLMDYVRGNKFGRSVREWYRLGEILAKLHSIEYSSKDAADLVLKQEPPDFYKISKIIQPSSDYMRLVSSLPQFSRLTQGIVHSDIHIGNLILTTHSGDLMLLDWESSGVGAVLFDLAWPLINDLITYDGDFEKDKAQAFYKAYSYNSALTDHEKQLIFDAALFRALSDVHECDWRSNWNKIRVAKQNESCLRSVVNEVT